MTLRCPHCGELATHHRRNVLGNFVICRNCERHFPWSTAELVQPGEAEAVWGVEELEEG